MTFIPSSFYHTLPCYIYTFTEWQSKDHCTGGIEQEYTNTSEEYEDFHKVVDKGEIDERLDIAIGLFKELIIVNKVSISKSMVSDEEYYLAIKALEYAKKL